MKPRKRRYKKSVLAVMRSCGYGHEQAVDLLRQLDEALSEDPSELVRLEDVDWGFDDISWTPEELEENASQIVLSEKLKCLPRSVRLRLDKHGLTGNVTFLLKKYEHRFKNDN